MYDLINTIQCIDVLDLLSKIEDNSIDVIITDPPYFLDKLDSSWDLEKLSKVTRKQRVKNLPSGMKFDPEQGRRLYDWYLPISREFFRVLKPGGFLFSFSMHRLSHRMSCAIEDSGFWLRDVFIWLYIDSQPKAMSLNHFVDKMRVSEEYKKQIKKKLEGYKTPQVKSVYEPIIVAQKPYEGSLVNNFLKYSTGLFDFSVRVGNNMYPSNVLLLDEGFDILDKYFLVKKEKNRDIDHPTVKPVELIKYLILLSTVEGGIVLDPFVGSGTTALAAIQTNRKFICGDINQKYVEISRGRIRDYLYNSS